MQIHEYIEKHSLTQEQFAKKVGVTQGMVWQWVSGGVRVSAEKAVEIERNTDGEIKASDLRPELFADRAAAA